MKNLNELPEILEISDIMDYLGISRSGAYRLVRKKGFPAFKLLGRYTIQKASLIKWLARQEREAEKSWFRLYIIYIYWKQGGKKKMKRRGNSEGCITKDSRGKWIARLQIGYNSNGNPRIKTFSGNTPTEARRRMNNFKKNLTNMKWTPKFRQN